MDNVIYQIHVYSPMAFTHQGVATYARRQDGKIPFWPDPSKGWTRDYIRNAVKQVRIFQEKHKCRIYVGEFSAVGYAPGANQWIRDAIAVFEEYGRDWTYHAFREWAGWSVEHEADDPAAEHPVKYHRVTDSPRKQALLEGFHVYLFCENNPGICRAVRRELRWLLPLASARGAHARLALRLAGVS